MKKEWIFGFLGVLVLVSLTFDEIRYRASYVKAESVLNKNQSYDNLMDPWGKEFQIEKVTDNVRVISAGPDGKLNTRDDILFLKKRKAGGSF